MNRTQTTRGHKYERVDCPKCKRHTAYSRNAIDASQITFRRHKPCGEAWARLIWVGPSGNLKPKAMMFGEDVNA